MEFQLSIVGQRIDTLGMAGLQEFGALIKRARENLGMTGAELAIRLDRPHSFVVRIERGQNANPPDPQTFADLARILRISKGEMLMALGYLENVDPTKPADPLAVPDTDIEAMQIMIDTGDLTEREAGELLSYLDFIRNKPAR